MNTNNVITSCTYSIQLLFLFSPTLTTSTLTSVTGNSVQMMDSEVEQVGLWNANRAKKQVQQNKNILFSFHCQITENWVKQKHFVSPSLPNSRKLSETKTFHFCFKQMTTEYNKDKSFCLSVHHWEWEKENLYSFCFRNIVKVSGETKTFYVAWPAIKLEGKKFLFRYIFIHLTKV